MIVRAIESCPFRQRKPSRARAINRGSRAAKRERSKPRMIHFANSLLFIACFGSLAWGLKSFSERMPQKEAGFTPISVAGALFMSLHGICLFFFPAADGIRELAGLFLYAGALSLFWWSARISRRQPLELAYSEEDLITSSLEGLTNIYVILITPRRSWYGLRESSLPAILCCLPRRVSCCFFI